MRSILFAIKWVFLILVLQPSALKAQGWEKTYGGAGEERINDLCATPDGGFVLLGHSTSFNSSKDLFVVKVDVDGHVQWSTNLGKANLSEFGNDLEVHPDGGYAIAGTASMESKTYVLAARISEWGDSIWMKTSEVDSVYGQSMQVTSDGSYLIAGYKEVQKLDSSGTPFLDHDVLLLQFDSSGDYNEKTFGGLQNDEANVIIPSHDGYFYVGGYSKSFGAGGSDGYILKVNATGDTLSQMAIGSSDDEVIRDLCLSANNELLATGSFLNLGNNEQDIFIGRMDSTGIIELATNVDIPGTQHGNSIRIEGNNTLLITGETKVSPNVDRDVILIRVGWDGVLNWSNKYGGGDGDGGNAVHPLNDGGAAIAGFTNSFGAGNTDNYLIRTDSSGLSFSNLISGRVLAIFDQDCQDYTSDQGIPNWIIEVTDGERSFYASTDTNGFYSVLVDTGSFSVKIATQHPSWLPCVNEYPIAFSGKNNTINIEIPVKSFYDCPQLEVDISAPFLRRCFPSVYTVYYKNTGTRTAEDATVDVSLDPYMSYLDSSIPYVSQNGNTYTFDLGDVAVFESGSFKVEVLLDCDSTVTGQTHCVDARVFPDTFCTPIDPLWDGASIEVDGRCQGDSVVLTITNLGSAMAASLNFIIIEDHVALLEAPFWLDSLQDTTLVVYPEGKTIRFEANQSQGHPGNSLPAVTIEGCGGEPYSTGYVIQLPMNDGDPFVDIDCQESIASYDPNDKRGFPQGYGEEHYISANTDLEYVIRFQNTGNDTAFLVVIRDTLSRHLNFGSVLPGASSHPYGFELYNNGVIKFTFENIQLPDSTTNELASQGFVKYRIAQKANNPIGTEITNSAAIYFDFNTPIITNQTIHRIGENFIKVDSVVNIKEQIIEDEISVNVYPNPFDDLAHFELTKIDVQEAVFQLFDLHGKSIRTHSFSENLFVFRKDNLPDGVYFFHIFINDRTRISGKVVIGGNS